MILNLFFKIDFFFYIYISKWCLLRCKIFCWLNQFIGKIGLLLVAVGNIKKNKNVYVGFNCFIVFNNREIYGPFNPTQGAPSDSTLPSAHAEVVASKYVISIKSKESLKNAKLCLIHWTYNPSKNDWTISNGVPCEDCCKYLEKYNYKSFIISDTTQNLIEVNFNYLKHHTKKSSGRLYGK